MDYRSNEDYYLRQSAWDTRSGLSYNQVRYDNPEEDTPIVTLAELKLYGKLGSDTTEDALLTTLLIVANKMCEDYVNQNFTQRSVTAYVANANGGTYLRGPVGTITSVTQTDGTALTTDQYKFTAGDFKQILWPRMDLVIVYECGWSTCPATLLNAVKEQALWLSENRANPNAGLSPAAEMILKTYRRV